MSTFLSRTVDFARHNDEVRALWAARREGKPVRVPLLISGSITNYFANPDLNTRGYTYEQYFTDPLVQIQAQLEYQHYQRHNWLCDREMGLPDGGWQLTVDFQNSYDASWFGCPVTYLGNQLPDTLPLLEHHKEMLYDLPDLLPLDGGLIGRGIEFRDAMRDYCSRHSFMDRPILPPRALLGEGTDGILDLAYKLRGAENVLIDMYEDEEYYADLMDYITRNLIHRMAALRKLRWSEMPDCDDAGRMRAGDFGFADDAMTMISHDAYMKYVYPYHRQLVDAFSDGSALSMHLCGANMHHFEGLAKRLGVTSFDTGFPIDLGRMRQLVGPDVTIQGGPTVMLVKEGSEAAIMAEAKRMLASGVMDGGKFIMIAANNLAPQTPADHVATLYDAVKAYGMY